ncbi:MAG: hypothetical protein M1839_004491 [Geoglossum umbratile]|nr:MAG: hypothetical protein M1839_004491 [Geoglossum umbratile]
MAGDDPNYAHLVGKILPQTFSVGFVVLSYIVSYVGALTTLELLHLRTSRRGAYNWYLLFGSSVSMGGIAIWCMHYVANRAIILADAGPDGQISYSPGYTTLSFFVPIAVLLAAFSLLGASETVNKVRMCFGGALAGLAICGMHYLGQAGISNYDSVYSTPHVAGAAVIAVVASITALAVFFALRAAWTDSWWKRATCAIILAGAVSGMHWTAALGTQYRFRVRKIGFQQNLSAKQTVIIVIVFAIVACALLLCLALLAQRRRAQQSDRAQQVVLACAIFDSRGRLMVSPDGLVPNQKITRTYLEQSFNDVFCASHPVFLWIYRTSRNWSSVVDLVPGMKKHIRALTAAKASQPGSHSSLHSYDSSYSHGVAGDNAVTFRELFCISASALAAQIDEPLENIGVLYDEILNTGATKPGGRPPPPKDAEGGSLPSHPAFGRGQLLFVVRRANAVEAANLQASGYRFAEVQNVVDIMARSMQVEREELQTHIANLQSYSTDEHILEPGVHVTCFAIRACVKGGFDVLVQKDAKNLLPTVRLPVSHLSKTGLDTIQALDGMSVATCLATLRNSPTLSDDPAHVFITQFYDALVALADQVAEPFFQDATLISKPITAPCRGTGPGSPPGLATLIAFRALVPIQTRAPMGQLTYSPLALFNTQQRVYKNSPDHGIFARTTYREFAGIVSSGGASSSARSTRASRHISSNPKQWLEFRRSRCESGVGEDKGSSQTSLGGILVSQSVVVDVTEAQSDVSMEMHVWGTVGDAMKEEGDVVTFVNELLAACVPVS